MITQNLCCLAGYYGRKIYIRIKSTNSKNDALMMINILVDGAFFSNHLCVQTLFYFWLTELETYLAETHSRSLFYLETQTLCRYPRPTSGVNVLPLTRNAEKVY